MVAPKKSRKKASPLGRITAKEFVRELPASKHVTYKTGETIFKEGTKADSCCLIVKGRIQIFKRTRQGNMPVATAKEGEFIGEMAMLSGEKRSASAIASSRVEVIVINHQEFVNLLRAQHVFAARLALQLSSLLALRCSRLLKLIAKQPRMEPPGNKKIVPINVQAVLDRVYTLWAV